MAKEVRQREVEKFLQDSGWTLLRSKGGHNVWGNPDKTARLAIPHHRMISAGVVRQVIKTVPNTPANWQ